MSAEEKYGEGKEAERDDLDSSEDEMEGKEVDDAPFHCFVVDDTGFDLDCITMMCEECGFEVTGFQDWRLCDAALQEPDCPADLVMVDFHQPDFDAIIFLRKLQQMGKASVAMSGDNDLQIISECLREDLAADFLVKPVTLNDVASLPKFRAHNSHQGKVSPCGRHRYMDPPKEARTGHAYRGRVLQARNEDFHILVIDDNPFDAECIVQMCNGADYITSQVRNAADATAHIAKRKPDLVLMDWHMPQFDPRFFLEELKRSHIPVVVMSGDRRNHRVEAALDDGLAADFLPKPLQFDMLATLPKYKEWTMLSMLRASPQEDAKMAAQQAAAAKAAAAAGGGGGAAVAGGGGTAGGAPRSAITMRTPLRRCNSTSYMEVPSTISAPDMDRVLLGTSIVIVQSLSARPKHKKRVLGKIFKRNKGKEAENPFDAITNTSEVTSETLFKFLKDVYSIARWTPECNILALVLLMRLINSSEVTIHGGNWDILLLSSLMIAQKIWDDVALSNVDVPEIWRRVYPGRERINLKVVNKLERAFLEALYYDVYVSNSTYTTVYFEVHSLINTTIEGSREALSPANTAKLEIGTLTAAQRCRRTWQKQPEELAEVKKRGQWTPELKTRKVTGPKYVIC